MKLIKAIILSFTLLMFTPYASAQMSHDMDMSSMYVCPMHPHIHGEEGDTCPICGMDLVAMEMEEEPSNPSEEADFKISPKFVQTIGVKTDYVDYKPFGEHITAYGRIKEDATRVYDVSSRVDGWVEKLYASADGESVNKGDVLFKLYSPDLLSAQKDYISALKVGNKARINATKERLALLGVSNIVIQKLNKTKKALNAVPFYAEQSGVLSGVTVNEGAYVKAGQSLMMVHDLSKLWVQADVPEHKLLLLSVNDHAHVTSPTTGVDAHGKISIIHPHLNPVTKTAMVRVEVDNAHGKFKPNSFVNVRFDASKKMRLAIPAEAVLRNKEGAYAFVALGGGQFKVATLKLGAKTPTYVEVLEGLEDAEEVVVNGQFLLDAEANLKGVFNQMNGDDSDDAMEVNPHAHH